MTTIVLQVRLGPETFDVAVKRGAGLSDDEVVALARDVITKTTARVFQEEPDHRFRGIALHAASQILREDGLQILRR